LRYTIPELADPVPHDIDEATSQIGSDVTDALRGARLLVTGGTGFLGSWLTDVLLALNIRHQLDMTLTLLTRKKSLLSLRRPEWSTAPEVNLLEGDVRDFECQAASFTHVFHGATDVSLTGTKPLDLADAIVTGSRHVLDVAAQAGVKRYLFFSSGAVVGQSVSLDPIAEDALTAPPVCDPDAYSNAKRFAEHLHLLAAAESGMEMVIARGFAFVGPRMPLNKFAIGNFIRDALLGVPPRLNTSGFSRRSYLYAADAACWLIILLAKGRPGLTYNVGSDEALTVRELANRVARVLNAPTPKMPEVREADGEHPSYYVPEIQRIRKEFDLVPTVLLDDAILRTSRWAVNSGVLAAPADIEMDTP